MTLNFRIRPQSNIFAQFLSVTQKNGYFFVRASQMRRAGEIKSIFGWTDRLDRPRHWVQLWPAELKTWTGYSFKPAWWTSGDVSPIREVGQKYDLDPFDILKDPHGKIPITFEREVQGRMSANKVVCITFLSRKWRCSRVTECQTSSKILPEG